MEANLTNARRRDDLSPAAAQPAPDSARGPDKSPDSGRDGSAAVDGYRPRVTLPSHQEPSYYIGGNNGNAILEDVLNDLGWRRLKEKSDDSYTLRWCELKQNINYNTFKEGEQLVNHIPNCNLLTNKLGLLNSLQEYSRVCGSVKKKVPKLDFIPETFRVEDAKEREALKDAWKEGDVWICKPTGRNQGKGIFLVTSREELDQLCQDAEERSQQQNNKGQKPMNRVIQRYIDNPLLLNGKKFDIRAYMLVASTVPFLVLYHKGYIRLSMFDYENKFDNLAMHLTNQFVQKKDPMYKEMKEETVWDMDKFNTYVNEHLAGGETNLPKDWVQDVLPTRMKSIMTYCFQAVKHRLQCKVGYFDLYGFDFMIDSNMKTWLIEVNVNPTLATNCESLKTVVPPMVRETLYLAIECFDKRRKSRSVMPIQSLENFEIIHNGSQKTSRGQQDSSPSAGRSQQTATGGQRLQSGSPVRRSRSLSPAKEVSGPNPADGSYNRRTLTFLRPGVKPSPTTTTQPRQPAAGNGNNNTNTSYSGLGRVQLSPLNSNNNRTAAGQPQRSSYITHKMNNSRTFNTDKSHQLSGGPPPRQGPRMVNVTSDRTASKGGGAAPTSNLAKLADGRTGSKGGVDSGKTGKVNSSEPAKSGKSDNGKTAPVEPTKGAKRGGTEPTKSGTVKSDSKNVDSAKDSSGNKSKAVVDKQTGKQQPDTKSSQKAKDPTTSGCETQSGPADSKPKSSQDKPAAAAAETKQPVKRGGLLKSILKSSSKSTQPTNPSKQDGSEQPSKDRTTDTRNASNNNNSPSKTTGQDAKKSSSSSNNGTPQGDVSKKTRKERGS